MTYKNARLIVGTLNIAVVLFFCGLGLKESIPVRLYPKNEVTFLPHVWSFVYTFALYVVLSAPFDLLGGLILPWVYKKGNRRVLTSLLGWMSGVILQGCVALGCAISLMWIGRSTSTAGALIAIGILMALFLVLGGGLSKKNRSTGLREPLAAFIWNFGGVLLPSRYSEVSFLSAAGIVTLGIYVSLWSFLGVLVVPFFLGERSSRIHQMILFPSWVCFGFFSRCLPSVVGLAEYWVSGRNLDTSD